MGLAYIPTISIVGFYFHQYQSLAIGIASSGVGFGTIVFPALIHFLIETYGWRGSLLLLGGISFHLVLIGALLRPFNAKPEDINENDAVIEKKPGNVSNIHILKNTNFLVLCIHTTIISFGISVIYVHLSAYAASIEFSENQGTFLFSILGVSNLMGRLMYGGLNQLPYFTPSCLHLWGFLVAGVITALVPLVTHYYALMIYSSIFGMVTASFGAILPQIIVEILDISKLTSGYGYNLVFMAIGTLAGGPVAGKHKKEYNIIVSQSKNTLIYIKK